MTKLWLAFGPILCYFILMVYAAVMSSYYGGTKWVGDRDHVLTEYLIILQVYYALCLLGPTLYKIRKRVASNL